MSTNRAKSNSIIYSKSLGRIYRDWKVCRANKDSRWNGCSHVMVSLGKMEIFDSCPVTQMIYRYLFQQTFADSVVVLGVDRVSVFADFTKCQEIQNMQNQIDSLSEECNVPVATFVETVSSEEPEKTIQVFKNFLQSNFGQDTGLVVGIVKDESRGAMSLWQDEFTAASLRTVDVGATFCDFFSIKDANEVRNISTAASITNALLSKVRFQMEKIIDENCKISHMDFLQSKVMCYLKDPLLINKKLTPDSPIESSFNPIIQSGADCSFSNLRRMQEEIHFGVISIDLGTSFRCYCSEIARTYLIDPSYYVVGLYDFLLKLQMRVINLLVPDAIFSEVYEEALKLVKKKYPKLVTNFLPNCGWSTGLNHVDRMHMLDASCGEKVQPNMVLVVRLGFENVPNPDGDVQDAQSKVFSLLLADTVHVTTTKPQILTAKAAKSKSEISYSIRDEEEEEAVGSVTEDESSEEQGSVQPNVMTRRSTRAATNENPEDQKQLELHQKQLATIQQAEAIKKYSASNRSTAESKSEIVRDFCSYPQSKKYPHKLVKNRLFIDADNETIFLPIFGQSVPFHIRTVRSVSKTEDYLKITFKHPGAPQSGEVFSDNLASYLKEAMFRVENQSQLNDYVLVLNKLKKKLRDAEVQRSAMESLVVQESLRRTLNCTVKLAEVSIRPGVGQSMKALGRLEVHSNGLSYVIPKRGTPIDIIFKNVKYAFFQQAGVDEEGTLIHFHLHHALMIGKKKTVDVQFISRVVDTIYDSGAKMIWGDPDEVIKEQRERERINAENNRFKAFCEETHNVSGIEFEQPYKDLAFFGTYGRESVKFVPTTNCLVNLKVMPFLVLPLDDVEVVFFERATFQTRYFDLTFVLKDYDKGQVHVTDIYRESYYDMIRRWLDSCDVKFYVSQVAIMWKPFMEMVCKDVLGFWKEGGWSTYEDDAAEDEDDEENEEDEFAPSSSESEDYEVLSDDEFEDDDDEDEERDDVSDDWDEQEEKLRLEDAKREAKENKKRQRSSPDSGSKNTKKRNAVENNVGSFNKFR